MAGGEPSPPRPGGGPETLAGALLVLAQHWAPRSLLGGRLALASCWLLLTQPQPCPGVPPWDLRPQGHPTPSSLPLCWATCAQERRAAGRTQIYRLERLRTLARATDTNQDVREGLSAQLQNTGCRARAALGQPRLGD